MSAKIGGFLAATSYNFAFLGAAIGMTTYGILLAIFARETLPAREKPALSRKLEKLRKPPGFTGRAPGGPSRWSTERSGEWEPLAPKLVVEVRYDHVSGARFRHGTALLRWRPDKAPKQCTFEQLAPELRPSEIAELFGE